MTPPTYGHKLQDHDRRRCNIAHCPNPARHCLYVHWDQSNKHRKIQVPYCQEHTDELLQSQKEDICQVSFMGTT